MNRLKIVSDTVVLEDEGCICEMFEYLKKYRSEPEWTYVKSEPVIAEYDLLFFVSWDHV